MPADWTRKIIHIDMDCFYAAIEMRDRPELRGRPIAVGGARDRRGVLTTASYEARKFGVRSAMPTWIALRKCPDLIVVPTRFEIYRRDSARLREIFHTFTDLVEPLSLDEAYLDISHLPYEPAAVAAEIRDRIREELALTASAGIAENKLLAKIASDWEKPDGQFEIRPGQAEAFMPPLPVRKLWGIGQVTAKRLEQMGVTTCGQMQRYSLFELHRHFGKFGLELYEQCRGLDDRSVEPHRERKSLSNERTFSDNLITLSQCEERLGPLYEELLEDLAKRALRLPVHKLVLKLKFSDFSRTTIERVATQPELRAYKELLEQAFRRSRHPIRLMGVGVRFARPEDSRVEQLELRPL